jgi:radical SAM superfamily enzyme YgiQ (UPF0313 family)
VAGGHLATALARSLLAGNRDLDAVVRYDGEKALLGIGECLRRGRAIGESVANLAFRRNGEVIETPVREVDLKKLPLPRRDVAGVDLGVYFRNFQSTKHQLRLPFTYCRPTNTYSHKGCPFRIKNKGCSFCSRVDTRFRQKRAAQVYEEYAYLADECCVDHISDFSDSWVSTPFLRQLAEQYDCRGPVGATLRVYGDVRLITRENARIMRQLGVDTVLLGIESGDERVLRMNGKPTSRQQILSTVRLLAANSIKVADAYVLGLIGETRESVRSTVEIARELRRLCETEISYWNIMTPLPGSQVWRFLEAMGAVDYGKGYHLPTSDLERIAVDRLCSLGRTGYEYLIDVREQMLAESRMASAEFVPSVAVSHSVSEGTTVRPEANQTILRPEPLSTSRRRA